MYENLNMLIIQGSTTFSHTCYQWQHVERQRGTLFLYSSSIRKCFRAAIP